MKFLKWFSLFFVCMCVSLFVGIYIGFRMEHYFYPPDSSDSSVLRTENESYSIIDDSEDVQAIPVSVKEERLDADTVYVLIERDMDTQKEVETELRIPEKYMGMDREQFLVSMDEYEANPPLSELERGFVSLEVLSFSEEKVQVLMNYSYVKPSNSFYIVVYDGEVVVLLEDRKTIFLRTDILLLDLPTDIQQIIMQGMFVTNEEELYGFLETYTS